MHLNIQINLFSLNINLTFSFIFNFPILLLILEYSIPRELLCSTHSEETFKGKAVGQVVQDNRQDQFK